MGEEVLRWEVRPCQDAQGNFRCYDICLPAEPEAKGIAVVASVFSGEAVANEIAAAHNQALTAPMSEDEALERWGDIQDDPDAIVECGERWKRVASAIGCELSGFNDGRSASFFTPDGNVIEVGPKFRAAITALHAHEPLPVKDEDAPLAYREGIRTAARMVRRFMGDQYGPNSALMIDVDKGVQADKATLAYVLEALEARAARLEEKRHG
jgi:hypothetical protein